MRAAEKIAEIKERQKFASENTFLSMNRNDLAALLIIVDEQSAENRKNWECIDAYRDYCGDDVLHADEYVKTKGEFVQTKLMEEIEHLKKELKLRNDLMFDHMPSETYIHCENYIEKWRIKNANT